mmetsp:Transcript_5240/g.9379  ORF Transcript_5240/g.9379 Transcript_5240/m.9379 type:complete len:266 (-) Transcript_5240:721-1518(-)|eukprot:CAMPEP_0197472882 /NCGR_PEP_ID=MMETSP1309-20131121/4172_1 /TAXON_ID=464262 /ORGANISM="Genus nov. species nov., Strain RCC998" /LENGTH=265 /DNA_ID=CAMNT_0043011715 /DNA_START=511 /DNA_END=1308 /DNA_ORIENTATION=+
MFQLLLFVVEQMRPSSIAALLLAGATVALAATAQAQTYHYDPPIQHEYEVPESESEMLRTYQEGAYHGHYEYEESSFIEEQVPSGSSESAGDQESMSSERREVSAAWVGLEGISKEETRGHKRFFWAACACGFVFLLLRKFIDGVEETDMRPIHVLLQRPSESCVGKVFPRDKCRTLGELKTCVAESLEDVTAEDQTVVFNGRELTDEAMDLGQSLQGVCHDPLSCRKEHRVDQRCSWGSCRSYDLQDVGLAFLAIAMLSIFGSL